MNLKGISIFIYVSLFALMGGLVNGVKCLFPMLHDLKSHFFGNITKIGYLAGSLNFEP